VRVNSGYATLVTPAIAIEVALVWLPPMLFAIVYGPLIGGLLALVQRLGSAPLTIANQSMGQLVHRLAGDLLAEDHRRVVNLAGLLFAVTLPLLAVLLIVLWLRGEEIAVFAFGAGWRDAGRVALIFAPLFYVQFLSLVTNRLMLVMGRMRLKLIASVIHLGLLSVTIPISRTLDFDPFEAMAQFSGLLVLSHLTVFFVVLALVWRHRH
jgi:O-antigen/teichoic acid export membrane protein